MCTDGWCYDLDEVNGECPDCGEGGCIADRYFNEEVGEYE